MVRALRNRLQNYNQLLVVAVVAASLLMVEAALGRRIPAFKQGFLGAIMLSLALVGIAAAFWKIEAAIALLGALSMYGNPTVFSVQGRQISTLHLLGGLVLVAWVLRRIMVEKSLRAPSSPLNKPLLALVIIWLVSWIAGITFWDIRVPTAHRQPLFFVAEFGQLLMFIGVFWTVADTVKSDRWAKIICAIMIISNASTVIFGGQLACNQLAVTLALTYSLLLFGQVDGGVKAGLMIVLVLSLWGLIRENRIPFYLASMAVVLVVSFFKSRRLLGMLFVLFTVSAVTFIKPLWVTEASIPSRQELARLALSIFRDHPILGIGPTHYRSYAILYHPGWWGTVESGMLLPHDVWLYFLANVGVVGLAGLLWVVSSVLLKAFVAYRQAVSPFSRTLAISALAATVGIVIQSAGGHMAFWPDYGLSSFYMVPYWILVGLAAARKRQWGVT